MYSVWFHHHHHRLNLMPPAPLYLRTLWCYTNAVIIIIIIIHKFHGDWRHKSQTKLQGRSKCHVLG